MLFSKQTPAAGGTAFAQFDAAWCYDGNGYILNDTGTSLDVRIGASGSVQTLAASALLPIKLVYSMAELYVRRTDQSTTQVTVEAQVGTGSAGGGTTPVQAGVIAATAAAAAVAGHDADPDAHGLRSNEIRDWQFRVFMAGGFVTSDEVLAVAAFDSAIKAAGIRGRFARLNPRVGDVLAATIPLYQGRALSERLGFDGDQIVGGWVSADYSRRGATRGFKGNTTNKFFISGVPCSNLAISSRHMAFDQLAAPTAGARRCAMGATTLGNANRFDVGNGYSTTADSYGLAVYGATPPPYNLVEIPSPASNGLVVASCDTVYSRLSVGGGAQSICSYIPDAVPFSGNIWVHASNSANTPENPTDARIATYSFGDYLTPSEITAYVAAVNDLNSALA